MSGEIRILGLRLTNGKISCLAWTNDDLSKRQMRSITKKFKKDPDVVKPCLLCWTRLYNSMADVKRELPRI